MIDEDDANKDLDLPSEEVTADVVVAAAADDDDDGENYKEDEGITNDDDAVVAVAADTDDEVTATAKDAASDNDKNDIKGDHGDADASSQGIMSTSKATKRMIDGVDDANKDLELFSLKQLEEEIKRLDERKNQAQERIKHLIATGKRPRRNCSEAGCKQHAQKGGLCDRHRPDGKRGPFFCKHEGCTKHVQRGGVCYTHGAKFRLLCNVEGCMSKTQKGSLCSRHSREKSLCVVKYCRNVVKEGGRCQKHID